MNFSGVRWRALRESNSLGTVWKTADLPMDQVRISGAAPRDRTENRLNTDQVLYLLSFHGVNGADGVNRTPAR